MKYIIAILLFIIVIGGGAGFYFYTQKTTYVAPSENKMTETPTATSPTETASTTAADETAPTTREPKEKIGTSVNGNDIYAYHFGTGDTEILLIGGTHGAYSANTIALGHELIANYTEQVNDIPDNITLTIIPILNPDGLEKITGTPDIVDESGAYTYSVTTEAEHATTIPGRFNGNTVDLNRNFDCDWQAESTWRNQPVSGGDKPFSEPEAAALRDYITKNNPTAVVVWFSAEGKVYPSSCGGAPSNESVVLAKTYATAAGYPVEETFDAYQVNGDMVNWMAEEGIAAISVLLPSHTSVSLPQNSAGVAAILKAYSE